MKGLSIFSRKKVKDEKDKHDDVLQNEKDANSLETMSSEMTSLKRRLLFKEEEVQSLKDMVAQKDEEIKRLKELLRVRDLKVDVLRADIESAWKKFDTFLSISSPERSKNETKHEKEPREEEMPHKQDEIPYKSICRPLILGEVPKPSSPFGGPPLHSYLSIAESYLVGAQNSRGGQKQDEIRFQPNFRPLILGEVPIPSTEFIGPPHHSYLSIAESNLIGAQNSIRRQKQDEIPFKSIFHPVILGEVPIPSTEFIGSPRHSYLSIAESNLVGAKNSLRSQKQDEIPFKSIFHPLIFGEVHFPWWDVPIPSITFIGLPRQLYLSIAESNLVGAQNSRGSPDQIPGYEKTRR